MRNTQFFFPLLLIVVSGAVWAEAEFDFEEMMKDVETQTQNVQNSISAQDANTALADAKKLQDEFKLVESYFQKRTNADDAVSISKKYQEKALAIQNSLAASDYNTAAAVAGDFSKDCRGACHDKYKPL
jgi:hypothetical protein